MSAFRRAQLRLRQDAAVDWLALGFGLGLAAALLLSGCAFYTDLPRGVFSGAIGEASVRASQCGADGAPTMATPAPDGLEVRGAAVSTPFVTFLNHTVDAVIGFFRGPAPQIIVTPAPPPEVAKPAVP